MSVDHRDNVIRGIQEVKEDDNVRHDAEELAEDFDAE